MKPGDFVVRKSDKGSEVLQVSFGEIRSATDIEIAIAVQAEIARTNERLEALRKTAREAFERALKAGREPRP